MSEPKRNRPVENVLDTDRNRTRLATSTKTTGTAAEASPTIASAGTYPPRINSKLILQNMEEVLHTVKQQHKEKHRRKKELKKQAIREALSSECILKNGTEDEHSEQKATKHKQRDKEKRSSKKKPLQEKTSSENDQLAQESPVKSGTILQHFQRTPKKEESDGVLAGLCMGPTVYEEKARTPNKNHKLTNAFEVMMNARNKSIGSNTPGKEPTSPPLNKDTGIIASRKLKLQEWADQKGGIKRKLEEDARALYVEERLQQRAKRLKHMIVNSSSPKANYAEAKLETMTKRSKGEENSLSGKAKKKRAKSRVWRLSSIDSTTSNDGSTKSIDTDTESFLANLNSPTKKGDSILGFFPKQESPKEKNQENPESNDSKRQHQDVTPRSYAKKIIPRAITSKVAITEQKEQDIGVTTPNGRPRRSCTAKARYDYNSDNSPTKDVRHVTPTLTRKVANRVKESSPANRSHDEIAADVIVVLDDSLNLSPRAVNALQGTPKKLAPLFVRSMPKPSPDPDLLKARNAFLQSGVPEKLRIGQEKQKQHNLIYLECAEAFPKISHVLQLMEDEKLETAKRIGDKFKLLICEGKSHSSHSPHSLHSPHSSSQAKCKHKKSSIVGTLTDCKESDFLQAPICFKPRFAMEQISLPSLANKRAIVKLWKTEYDRFPTYKCYNQMREKYRYFSAIDSAQNTEQVTESFVVTRRTRRSQQAQNSKKYPDIADEEYRPPVTAPNGELLFSEKYKPLLFEQILVNLNPVTQLREFLSGWSCSGSGPNSAKNSQDFEDSMDNNDSASQGPSCNTVVLLGPASSGKTNAVFALANDMNFNVLEINAGMKRTGKKLIQELQEATQSHQIRKDAIGHGTAQKSNLLKMSLSGLKSKSMRQNPLPPDQCGSDSSNGELAQSARKSLILIEDADIVFDQTDAGFTDAIYTLAASSKRPVIVVATNPNSPHLQRLMSQNTIHFPHQNVLNISRFLSVLSLIENCPVLLDDIVSLYLYNKRDLRKTLLELQFFIQSGGDKQKQVADDKANACRQDYQASPRKRQFSVEQIQTTDNYPPFESRSLMGASNTTVYMHRSLFEFYTVCQNSKSRVPFPIDFQKLWLNLADIFKVSHNLSLEIAPIACNSKAAVGKRKSKSPKKKWLTNALRVPAPLQSLCSFYDNISVAALMDKQLSTCAFGVDRLNHNLSEYISHSLVETAIEVNLNAEMCPYNLFDAPKEILSLCDVMGMVPVRSGRIRNLDYEPCLRSICRSEQLRATLERRSTRFYHHLRSYTTNASTFSLDSFDEACDVFRSLEPELLPAKGTQSS